MGLWFDSVLNLISSFQSFSKRKQLRMHPIKLAFNCGFREETIWSINWGKSKYSELGNIKIMIKFCTGHSWNFEYSSIVATRFYFHALQYRSDTLKKAKYQSIRRVCALILNPSPKRLLMNKLKGRKIIYNHLFDLD